MKKQSKRTLLFYVVMAVAMALPLNSFAKKSAVFSAAATALIASQPW